MQQLDDFEIWKVPQELLSEEPTGDVDEMNQSPDGPEKGDGRALLSSEGRSGAQSIRESAPASPHRATSAEAEDDLPNGEMQEGDPFGNGCSPEEAEVKAIPEAMEKGDPRPHQGSPEAASAANPAGQSSDPSKAPSGRQRKLAMEEIVIRDHLGQEVGCMDAVGQNQGSLEKEEGLEDHTPLGGSGDSWSQPGPVDGVSDQKPALGGGPPDQELGSRDGPEGQSPTSQDHQGPCGLPEDEHSDCKGQGNGPLETGSLAKEAGGEGGGQQAVPGQGAQEMEPTQGLATGDAPAAEPVEQNQGSQMKTPEQQESGAREEGQGHKRPGSQLEQLTPSLPHQCSSRQEVKDLSSQEEIKMSLLVLPSSPTQNPVVPQDKVPSLQGTKESLLDQIPSSFQENEGSLLDPELSFLSNQSPLPPLDQNFFVPEGKGSLLDQTPSSLQGCLSEQDPPSLQDPVSSSLERNPSPVHLPDVKHTVMDQAPSSLHEDNGTFLCQSQMHTGTQITSLLDQPISPLPEDEPLALEDIPSSWHEMGKPIPQQEQELPGYEMKGSLPDSIPSLTNQLSSLPDQIVSLPGTKISASEETPAPVQDQMPMPPEAQVSSLPEADVFLPSQVPPSEDDPHENPVDLLEQIPPVLQDMESTSLVGKTPASSLQEADGALPDEVQTPLPIHTSPNLPEDEGSSPNQAPPTSEDQTKTSELGQDPSFQDAAKSPSEGQNSPDPPKERSNLAERTPSPEKAQSPVLLDESIGPNALPLPSQETLQPLLDKMEVLEMPDAKESGNTSMASAGEIVEVLENLHAEQQPLLKEAKASGAPPDISIDLQSKTGISKPPGPASQQTPNNSTYTSANTASSHQLQAALPCQDKDQEPEKGKRKSCQCCLLM